MTRLFAALALLVSAPALAQDGQVDASFGTDGVVAGLAEARPIRLADLAVTTRDEAVYVGWSGRTDTEAFIGRVTPDGQPDAGFGSNGQVTLPVDGSGETLRAVAVGTDGRIVAVGQATSSTGTDPLVAVADASGSLDAVTVLDVGESARGEGVAIDGTGAYVAVSLLDTPLCAVVRVRLDGALDTSFGTDGLTVLSAGAPCEAADLVATRSGVVIAGTLDIGSGAILVAQLRRDGSLDPGFGEGGVVRRAFDSSRNKASSVSVGPDGGLVVAGLSAKGDVAGPLLLRFDAAGAPLASFGHEGLYWSASAPSDGVFAEPPGVAVLPDGRVTYATTTAPTIRLTVGSVTASGDRDRAFGTEGFATADESVSRFSYGRAIAVDSQGRLLVGGEALVGGTLHRLVISRLTTAAVTSSEAAPLDDTSLRIGPNPTTGHARVRFTLGQTTRVEATLLDSLGREVARLTDGDAPAGAHTLDLDASGLAPGLYLVRLVAGDTVTTRRLTVAR